MMKINTFWFSYWQKTWGFLKQILTLVFFLKLLLNLIRQNLNLVKTKFVSNVSDILLVENQCFLKISLDNYCTRFKKLVLFSV